MSGGDMTRTIALNSARTEWGRELVASLPRSVGLVEGPVADIALIDGTDDWTATAMRALDRGARTLMVVEPGPVDPAALSTLADAVDAAGADVRIGSALAEHAAMAGFRDLIDDSFGELVVDGQGGDGLTATCLLQLRLLRAAGIDNLRLTAIAATQAAFLIEGEGRSGGVTRRLRMTGAMGIGPVRVRIVAHGDGATARLSWRGDAAARPVEVSLADASGLRTLPTIYESGQRTALRALLASTGAGGGSAALRGFHLDLVQLHELLGAP